MAEHAFAHYLTVRQTPVEYHNFRLVMRARETSIFRGSQQVAAQLTDFSRSCLAMDESFFSPCFSSSPSGSETSSHSFAWDLNCSTGESETSNQSFADDLSFNLPSNSSNFHDDDNLPRSNDLVLDPTLHQPCMKDLPSPHGRVTCS